MQNSCRPGSAILDVPSHKYFSSETWIHSLSILGPWLIESLRVRAKDFRPELDPEPTLADFLQLLREAGRSAAVQHSR